MDQIDLCRSQDGSPHLVIASNPFYFIVLSLGSMQVQVIWSNPNELGISSLSLNLGPCPDFVPNPFHFIFFCCFILGLHVDSQFNLCTLYRTLFIRYLLMRSFIKFTGNSKKKVRHKHNLCCPISHFGTTQSIFIIVFLYIHAQMLNCLIFG